MMPESHKGKHKGPIPVLNFGREVNKARCTSLKEAHICPRCNPSLYVNVAKHRKTM